VKVVTVSERAERLMLAGSVGVSLLVEDANLVLDAPGDEEGADDTGGKEAEEDPEGDVNRLASREEVEVDVLGLAGRVGG
jgi:hypothetical protein